MSMNNLDLLADDNIAEDREEREDGGKGGFSVDDEERHIVDLEAVGKISYSSSSFVCMGDDDNFVPTVNELGGQLVDVTFDAAGLWEEAVADHSNVVRHFGGSFART
jgi:hypothetical protein